MTAAAKKIRVVPQALPACPLCGSEESRIVLEERNDFAYAHAEWSYLNEEKIFVKQCAQCTFGYTASLPPDFFFEDILYNPPPGAPVSPGPDIPCGKEFIFRHILDLLQKFSARGFLLDIGACSGRFLYIARGKFKNLAGVENDPTAASQAAKFGIELKTGSARERIAEFREKVDIITLIDVLEHLAHPKDHIANLHATLRSGGLLYIKVPHLSGQLFKERWIARLGMRKTKMATNYVHINHFSEASLVKALERAGFEVLYAQVAPPELYRWENFHPKQWFSNLNRFAQYYFARAVRSLSPWNLGLNLEVLARKK